MALKPCRECKHDVSELAPRCPHCGVPRPLGRDVPDPSRTGVGAIAGGTFLGMAGCSLIIIALTLLASAAGIFATLAAIAGPRP